MIEENIAENIDASFHCVNDLFRVDKRYQTFQILSLILDSKQLGNWREPVLLARLKDEPNPEFLNHKKTLLSAELTEASRCLMDRFDSLHGERLQILMKDMTEKMKKCQEDFADPEISDMNLGGSNTSHIDSLKNQFNQIFDLLFRDKVNWGRIISLFGFLRGVCSIVEQRYKDQVNSESRNNSKILDEDLNSDSGMSELSQTKPQLRAAHYVIWTTIFIHESKVYGWIEENGGWEGLIAFHQRSSDSEIGMAFRIFEEILKKSSFVICSAILITLGALLCRYLKH